MFEATRGKALDPPSSRQVNDSPASNLDVRLCPTFHPSAASGWVWLSGFKRSPAVPAPGRWLANQPIPLPIMCNDAVEILTPRDARSVNPGGR